MRRSESPAAAILREIKRGGYDFVVMGVSRRPGEQLYLGSTAAAMLKRGDFSLLFVASETYGQERRPTEKQEVAK